MKSSKISDGSTYQHSSSQTNIHNNLKGWPTEFQKKQIIGQNNNIFSQMGDPNRGKPEML